MLNSTSSSTCRKRRKNWVSSPRPSEGADIGVQRNYQVGHNFEAVFQKLAQLDGFFVVKNHHTCRFLPNGRVQVIHGQLDFTLIDPNGNVGFFDCKSYQGSRVIFSQFNEKQLERSVQYNQLNVPSGFIAHFRETDQVVLLRGEYILLKGPRSSFGVEDGLLLGSGYNFKVTQAMAKVGGHPWPSP